MDNKIDINYIKNNTIITKQEMEEIIGEQKIREIQFFDSHPLFQTYIIAHEGQAKSENKKVFKYVKKIIVSIYENLNNSIGIFHRHKYKGNSRPKIGEIVGKKIIEIEDLTTTLMIVYIYPEYRDLDLDIASMELEFLRNADMEVIEIKDISGIALSDYKSEKPGFELAHLVEQVQFFIEKETEKGDQIMDFDTIKENIKKLNIKPTDIFGVEEILADATVDGNVKKMLQEKHEHARRVERKLADVEKIRELDLQKLKEYQNKIWGLRVNESINEKFKDNSLPDPVKDLIRNKIINKVEPELDSIETEDQLIEKIEKIYIDEYSIVELLKESLLDTETEIDQTDKEPVKKKITPKTYPKPAPNKDLKEPSIDDQVDELLKV